ncbi:RHS repeat-associated core domain-containing protein [Pedobacter hiemivivus]|uniref:RHS repeat-associated core domain-containing protein n=1 Tax=Pedobacter hiemivivus TaxID=2530454 RepID=A0A4U1GBJ5_9SPHI|nr:DUF6443 domain-containing protein [Pedobacter hiemivivus]TKC60280.1 RHS repeat-associated core domain-containing protein [Pedobacter hiemivivus]
MVLNTYTYRFIALLFVSILSYLPLKGQELIGGGIGHYQPPSETINMTYGNGRIRISNLGNASGGTCSGFYQYQWQLSYNEVDWEDLYGYTDKQYDEAHSGEIAPKVLPGESGAILYFRRKVICGNEIAYSDILRIYLEYAGGGVSPSVSNFNSDGSFEKLEGTENDISYVWQISRDYDPVITRLNAIGNGYWENLLGGTEQHFLPSEDFMLDQPIYIRRLLLDGRSSNIVKIMPNDIFTIGDVMPQRQMIAKNAPVEMLSINEPDIQGNYHYQWQEYIMTSGSWEDIIGANERTYLPIATDTKKLYRVAVVSLATSVELYSYALIDIVPFEPGRITTSNQVLTSFTAIPNLINTTEPSEGLCDGNYTYQWEQSIDNKVFIAMPGSKDATLSFISPLEQTTYYRRKVTCGEGSAYSYGNGEVQSVMVRLPNVMTQPYAGNYTFVWKANIPFANPNELINSAINESSKSVQYFDDFGRPEQDIAINASPTNKDILRPVVYDVLGREDKKYLPYTIGNNHGQYRSEVLNEQAIFYQSPPLGQPANSHPYTKAILENSPMNRVLEQGAEGSEWQPQPNESGHTVKAVTTFNNTVALTDLSNTRAVMMYGVSLSGIEPTLIGGQVYPANQLIVNMVRGENWKAADGRAGTAEEYTDQEGKVVLKRGFNKKNGQIEILSTYYVYDDLGNLTFILPPGSFADLSIPNTTLLNDICYQYKYDYKRRKIEQKIPGKGVEYMLYNPLNQLVGSQDANQRLKNEWLVSKYDKFGRVVITGVLIDNSSRQVLQNQIQIDQQYRLWETKVGDGIGYTNLAWPVNISSYYIINYYDNYEIPGLPYSYQDFSSNVKKDQPKGLLTASKVRLLNDASTFLWTVQYYNQDAQVIQVHSGNHLGGKDVMSSSYDFSGKMINSQRAHTGSNGQSVTIKNNYIYDHGSRLVDVKQKTGNDAEITLVHNTYNELGQLIDKKLHLKQGESKYLQSIDYRYNVRGWLSTINDPELGNNTQSNLDDTSSGADLFGTSLKYENASDNPQYNGNIAAMTWKTGIVPSMSVAPPQLGYNYRYDNVNQLIVAISSTNGIEDGNHNELISYNQQGNITNLDRWAYTGGAKQQIDKLEYTYNGNKHSRVDDLSTATGGVKALGFEDIANQPDEYLYDDNGNMVQDLNKDISISYNVFNLPETISFTANPDTKIEFVYDCTGRKLQRKFTQGTTLFTTDYIDGIQYEQNQLAFLQTGEGRVRKIGETYSYEYDITDHLGNVRVTFMADPNDPTQTTARVIQQNSYYPYGMLMYGDAGNGLNLAFASGEKSMYLYSGKELQEQGGVNWYDHGARMYDPVLGRWSVMDPANQFDDLTPYSGMGNNPLVYVDPDGRFIHIVAGAIIGGVINLGVKALQGKIHNFGDGLAAFGIGAVAGGIGAATGGAALAASGFTATSIGGGIVSGLAGSMVSSPVLGLGNQVYFGDPYSLKSFGQEALLGGIGGGLLGALTSKAGSNIWSGAVEGIDPYLPISPKMITDATINGNIVEITASAKGAGTSLTRLFESMNTNTKGASEFFGWGNKTTLTKSISNFTKEELLKNGWTKENLVKLARAYNDQIVKAQLVGAKNLAAIVRRDQAMDLARSFFGN